MGGRWYPMAVIACWLAAMSWLTVQKILPALQGGEQPDYHSILPEAGAPPEPVCWEIQYNGKVIGWAASLSKSHENGAGEIQSVVHFDRLPLSEILRQVLGNLGALVRPFWARSADEATIDMTVDSHMLIAEGGRLDRFVTNVRLAELEKVVQMRGATSGSKLKVEVYTPQTPDEVSPDPMQLRYRDELDVPADALVTGALSPQAKMANLRVGQTWIVPVYRPFPPNSPLQLMQAKVEGRELIVWNGQPESVLVVAFRDDAGTGITVSREPVGRLRVRNDGTVLEQETRLSSLLFKFVRLPENTCGDRANLLERLIEEE